MNYDLYLLILGGACSLIVSLITVLYNSRVKREEDLRKALEERLVQSESRGHELKEFRDELKSELSKITIKLTDVSYWQNTFQIELVAVKKDIEMLSKDIATLQSSRYRKNYGKNIPRQTSDSQRKR
jgi:peptidoglycan hydrolase CwlO-like protein